MVATFFISNVPNFTIQCGNKACGHINEFSSKNVFENDVFQFKCEKCGNTTSFNSSNFIEDFNHQMKSSGF